MIIGRDMLKFLGVDIRFSTETVEWAGRSMPFKDVDDYHSSFHVDEPQHLEEAHERLKQILDAKYEAADLQQICEDQPELNHDEQQKLLRLLNRHKHLFDGALGK